MKRKLNCSKETIPYRSNSPSTVIFRSKQTRNRSYRPSAEEQSFDNNLSGHIVPNYTLEYCVSRLNQFIGKGIPLSKNCAHQIRYFLGQLNSSEKKE